MIIVVNDACLLIDLIDIDLLDEFLQLGIQAHITSSVLLELDGDEYEVVIRKNIKTGRLLLSNLTANDQVEIADLMQTHSSRLSEPDCSCLHLAKKINATILTCEKLLRSTARSLEIPVHGSLWVLDQLIYSSIITKRTAHRKLNELMLINARLPKKECRARLKRWE
jgi:predicted nucleic acid-binding protein